MNYVSIHTLCLHCKYKHGQRGLKSKNGSYISFCRYEHRAVSKQLCGLLAKLPSLRLRRGIKCGRRIQGRLVVSFIVQRSFVMPIRVSAWAPSHCILCLPLQLHVRVSCLTHVTVTCDLLVIICPCSIMGLSHALPTVPTLHFLPCISKTSFMHCQVVVSSCV